MTQAINIRDINWDTHGEDRDLPVEMTVGLDQALSEETLNLISEELS